MEHNIIAQSKSGKTYIILNGDGTIGFNSNIPICNLSQLKWLKLQPSFRAGFLSRIKDSYFEGIEPAEFSIESLPVLATAVQIGFDGNIEDVRTWRGNSLNGCFCQFKKTETFAFVANTLVDQSWVFLQKGETVEMFQKRKEIERQKKEVKHQEWLKEMYATAEGWYVVTLDVLVSKIRGNDGAKTYSFKVLANNQMDAYDKACDLAMSPGGIKDRNISFVYNVQDSASSALIEYVGVWTDESEFEYGPSK